MAGSRSRRRRSRLHRRRWGRRATLITVLVVLAAGAGVWLVGFSSVFAVRDVQVDGAEVLSTDQVRDTARVPIGHPLARLNTDHIGTRVAELPPVRTVQVYRSWPNTVRINVVERTPRFAAEHNGDTLAVDDTGLGYTELTRVPDSMVIARGVPPEEWADVATVVRSLPRSVAGRAEAVTTRGPEAIVIHLEEGVTVEWGSAEQSADKALVLSSLMTAVPDAEVYNVSAPAHPATR